MKPDKFKKRYRAAGIGDRIRRNIAMEAARRLQGAAGDRVVGGMLPDLTEAEYYAAKRKAAAVLGHTVRPGDLPSDAEIRERWLVLSRETSSNPGGAENEFGPEPDERGVAHIGEHIDRFAVYRLRLEPLEAIKQDPRTHPEGDALYHSLQVFELARAARPYDEEFLLAALLHDCGKAVEPRDHIAAGLKALRGTLTPRTAWLIEHHHDLIRPLDARARRELRRSEWYEDLVLLREIDNAGTAIGAPVGTIDEALEYLRGLEEETYLDLDEDPEHVNQPDSP